MTLKVDVPNVICNPLSGLPAPMPAKLNFPSKVSTLEERIDAAVELLLAAGGLVSAKFLAASLQVKLPDAHLLLDELERRKFVSPYHDKGRELLVNKEEWASMKSAGVCSQRASSPPLVAPPVHVTQESSQNTNVTVVSETLPSKPISTEAVHFTRPPQPGEILIKDIIIEERFRKDVGDIPAMAHSITRCGLMQRIGISPKKKLVFGRRRVMGCELLGWASIPFQIIDLDNLLQCENDENELRKDFTASERVAIGKALEAKLPSERRGRDNPQNIGDLKGQETAALAAKAAGFGNVETYRQNAKAVEHGVPELVSALDKEEISASTAAVIATLPRAEQNAVVTQGPDAMKKAAEKLCAEKKSNAIKKSKPVQKTELVEASRSNVGSRLKNEATSGRSMTKNWH